MPDPFSQGTDAIQQNWSKKVQYAFSPLSDKPCTSKNSCNPDMAHSTLVSSTSGNVNSGLLILSKQNSQRSFMERTSISNEQYHEVSVVGNFRKDLAQSGISKTASHLIARARRESTTTRYESAWGKWVGINPVLEFLSELFEATYKYRTIGTHRSTVSIYHDFVKEMKVGVHPKASELIQGVFNARPAQAKHNFIWDVQTVQMLLKKTGEIIKRNFI